MMRLLCFLPLFFMFTIKVMSDDANPLKGKVWATYVSWASLTSPHIGNSFPDPVSLSSTSSPIPDFKTEIAVAQKAGIDGFLFDLTLPAERKDGEFYRLYIYDALLAAAKGTDFLVNPMFDGRSPEVDSEANALVRFHRKYIDQPNIMKIGGKIVTFGYAMNSAGVKYWERLFAICSSRGAEFYPIFEYSCPADKFIPGDVDQFCGMPEFHGVYNFFQIIDPDRHLAELKRSAKLHHKLFGGSISNGYIGAPRSWRSDWYWPFFGTGYLRESSESIIKRRPDFLHVTTWNDDSETEMRPTLFQQDCECRLLRYYIDRWRGVDRQPSSTDLHVPNIIFDMRREILAGEMLRIEYINLPSAKAPKSVDIKVMLYDVGNNQLLSETDAKRVGLDTFAVGEWRVQSGAWPVGVGAFPSAVSPVVSVTSVDGRAEEYRLPSVLVRHGRLENMVTMMTDLQNIPKDIDFSCKLRLLAPDSLAVDLDLSGAKTLKSCQLLFDGAIIRSFGKEDVAGSQRVALSVTPGPAFNARETLVVKVEKGKIGRVARSFSHANDAYPKWKVDSDGTLEIPILGEFPTQVEIIGDNNTRVKAQAGLFSGTSTLPPLASRGGEMPLIDSKGSIFATLKDQGADVFPSWRPEIGLAKFKINQAVTLPRAVGTGDSIDFHLAFDDGTSCLLGPYSINNSEKTVEVPVLCAGEDFDEAFMHFSANLPPCETIRNVRVKESNLQYDIWDFNSQKTYGGAQYFSRGSGRMVAVPGGAAWYQSYPEFSPKTITESNKTFLRFNGKDNYVILGIRTLFSGASAILLKLRPAELGRKQVLFGNGNERDGYKTMLVFIDDDGKVKVEKDEPTGLLPVENRTFWIKSSFRTVSVSSPASLKLNQWVDIMATYDFRSLSLYIDGVKVAEAPCRPFFVRGNSTLRLGSLSSDLNGRIPPGIFPFKGDLENVKYYGWPARPDRLECTPGKIR